MFRLRPACGCLGCGAVFDVPAGSGHLTIEWGPQGSGRRVPLHPPETLTIGRANDNDLCLRGPGVSRHHACIVWRDDGWLIEDLHSANGTYVDGQRVERGTLTHGSAVIIGDFALRVTLGRERPTGADAAMDALARESAELMTTSPTSGEGIGESPVSGQTDPREQTVVGVRSGLLHVRNSRPPERDQPTVSRREESQRRRLAILVILLSIVGGGLLWLLFRR
jgi:predicted component of type VI protein secretion system